jgi:hypothetical protein
LASRHGGASDAEAGLIRDDISWTVRIALTSDYVPMIGDGLVAIPGRVDPD